MSRVTRFYRRFDRWVEGLTASQYALVFGLVYLGVWSGFALTFDEFPLGAGVVGALVSVGLLHWFESS